MGTCWDAAGVEVEKRARTLELGDPQEPFPTLHAVHPCLGGWVSLGKSLSLSKN